MIDSAEERINNLECRYCEKLFTKHRKMKGELKGKTQRDTSNLSKCSWSTRKKGPEKTQTIFFGYIAKMWFGE